MNKNNGILWLVAALLIGVGFFQQSISSVMFKPTSAVVAPSDDLQERCKKLTEIVRSAKDPDKQTDMKKLVGLYLDLAKLISIDDEDTVIKNTEEIREANRLSGRMSDFNLKNKYEDLGAELNSIVLGYIGEDNAALSPELRQKGVDVFRALAWAINQGL